MLLSDLIFSAPAVCSDVPGARPASGPVLISAEPARGAGSCSGPVSVSGAGSISGAPAPAGAGAGSGAGADFSAFSEKRENASDLVGTIISDGDGWHGSKCHLWNSQQELKNLILADLKRAGISASIRFGRGGYTPRMDVTIRLDWDEVKPIWQYKPEWKPGSKLVLYLPDGSREYIDYSDVFELPEDQQKKTLERARKDSYLSMYGMVQSRGTIVPDNMLRAFLQPSAMAKLESARNIIDSYNHDHSDIMTDYFDKRFYSYCSFKIAPAPCK